VTFPTTSVQLGAGEAAAVSLGVKSREGNVVGSVRSRPFSVDIRPSSDAPSVTLSATFRHHPIIPGSAPTAAAVFLALAIGGFGVLNLAGFRTMIPSAPAAPSFAQVALEPSAPPSVAPAAPSTAAPPSASPTASPTPTPGRPTTPTPTPTPVLKNRFSASETGTLPALDVPLLTGSYNLWFRIDLPDGAGVCSQRVEFLDPAGTLKEWINGSLTSGTDPTYSRRPPPMRLAAGIYKLWPRQGDCLWHFTVTPAVSPTPTHTPPPMPTPPPTEPPAPS
jgi:hypothetical protein